MKKVEQKLSTLRKTVIAARILHNICIERGDLYDTDNNDSDDSSDNDNHGRIGVETGNFIREAVKNYVHDNFCLKLTSLFSNFLSSDIIVISPSIFQ